LAPVRFSFPHLTEVSIKKKAIQYQQEETQKLSHNMSTESTAGVGDGVIP